MSESTEKKTLTMEEFQAELTAAVEKQIREMGLDQVDRKHAMFGTQDDPNGDSLKDLSKDERVAKFLSAVVLGDEKTAKALSEGTPADGGYLVPTEFRAQVITKLYKESVMRRLATVIPMRRDKLEMPVEGADVTVYWTGENVEFTESNPGFGTFTLNANKLTGLSKMSRELFADSSIALIDYVANIFARRFAEEEDKKFVAGSGTNEPKGFRTETITSIAQAGANLSADDLIKLFYSLPFQYRSRASFILPNQVIQAVRLLKTSGGAYIWAENLNDATPTILGRPVYEQNDIPTNLGSGTNESEIFFGDFGRYIVGDREEMGVETSTSAAGAFEKHQVAFKTWERIDGRLSLPEAVRKMTAVK